MDTIREARAYWAHRLHTTVLNSIGAAILQSQVCERAVRSALPTSVEEVARLRRMLEALEGETRALAASARIPPPRSLREVLAAAVQPVRDQGLPVHVTCRGDLRNLSGRVIRAVGVVLTEALANAVRHGRPTVVDVAVTARDGMLLLRVRDDGAGCDLAHLGADRRGRRPCGIEIMRAQADALGGRLEVSSVPGRGTQVTLFVPTALRRRASGRVTADRS